MPRSATTGLYTRVDNSFSNPVVGTTISPTDADTFFDDVEASMNSFLATSTSSVAIGTGSKSLTVASSIATKAFLVGTFVLAFSASNTANYMSGTITAYSTITGVLAFTVPTGGTGGSGTITDWVIVNAGGPGPSGPLGGIKQTYSTTTADADPGAGIFRLNNATPASATAAYLDNLDTGGSTVSTLFDLWDDSTTTTKGNVRFEKTTDPTVWAQFAVTGSVVDGTGYRKLTLTSGAGSGAFTNADTFVITFFRSGDKGADGAGTGDFSSNTATSVDSEIVLFSSTAGKTGKRATTTGILKGTSGVLSAATAGTDYMGMTQTSQAFSGGLVITEFDNGTKSSGTFTPDPGNGPLQKYSNNGAHTLAAASTIGSFCLRVTNAASAGAITFSGFDKQISSDTYATTNTNQYDIFIKITGKKTYQIVALQ